MRFPSRLALFLCALALGGLDLFGAHVLIDKRVTIQPYQLARDDGSEVQNPAILLHEAECDKIWAQAGIDILFLPSIILSNSTFFSVVTGSSSAANWYGNLLIQFDRGQKALNMFFVDTIDNGSFNGFSFIDGNGFVIAKQALSRSDTIAHELGHNLGLDHTTFDAGGPLNLMTASVTPPASLNDIAPDGANRSQLVTKQINQARISFYVRSIIPFFYPPAEPPTLTMRLLSGAPTIELTGQVGQKYQFEFASPLPLLPESPWDNLGLPDLVLSNVTQSIVDTTFSGETRFYRARVVVP
jgi:hypothetical protein